jgi:uncharacterized protein
MKTNFWTFYIFQMNSMHKTNKVVVDTNVFISALVFKSKRIIDIVDYCALNQMLCFSQELVDEVLRILTQKFDQKQDILDQFIRIVNDSDFFTLTEIYHLEADPKDGYLLSLSKLAKADYLITGD